MKQLRTPLAIFGPYVIIEQLEDRYRCDGADLPFTVIGEAIIEDWDNTQPPIELREPTPEAISMRQARLGLLQAGLLSQVDTIINSLPEPDSSIARITWEYATEVERVNPLVLALMPALGLDDTQMDALFVAASKL